MYDYHSGKPLSSFNSFFKHVKAVHDYNTRLASRNTFYIDIARTNYGKFSLRFHGPRTWNSIDDKMKTLSKSSFKSKIAENLISSYWQWRSQTRAYPGVSYEHGRFPKRIWHIQLKNTGQILNNLISAL